MTTRVHGSRFAGVWTAAVLFCSLSASAQSSDTEKLARGEALFKSQCGRCHEIGAGAKNKVGPHLDQIFGRVAGSVGEYRYSSAMRKAGEEGLSWDADAIDAYVHKPRTFIKGNRMSYRGLDREQDRSALIAWLSSAAKASPTEDLAETASASKGTAPGFTEEILSIEADAAYGEYLAGDCVTCHQVSGRSEGIPSIVGIPKDYFVRSLVEYKTNVRSNEVMKLRVQSLADEEIAHLAEYFAGLEPQ